MKKTLPLVGILLLCSLSLAAQNKSLAIGRLFGKIVEKQTQQPAGFVSVAVYQTVNKKDSLVGGMLTKENGDFNIGDLAFGKLKVKITFLGFKEVQKMVTVAPPDVEQDLGNITLEVDTKVLKEVEITAEKSTMQLAIDRKVFNMDKNLHAVGGNAADALKSVPSVTVDGEGTILLRNQTPLIYMDGRPTPLSIQQIPADQIEQIEVITNPSAKFEAAAGGGIINLIMKKNKQIGFSGNYALGAGTGNRYTGMANLNFKNKAINFTLFLNENTGDFNVNGFNYRTNRQSGIATDYLNQDFSINYKYKNFSGRANLDYALNIRNTLSLTTAIVFNRSTFIENQAFISLNAQKSRQLYGNQDVKNDIPANDFNYVLGWKRTFTKKGKELNASFGYNYGNVNYYNDFSINLFTGDGVPMSNKPELQQNRGLVHAVQTSFTLDYSVPLNDSTKLETGIRSVLDERKNRFHSDTFDYSDVKYNQINYLALDYSVENYINAAYVNVLGKLKKGWSYQAGFRYEQSNSSGKSNLDGQRFSYSFPSENLLKTLFPSLYFNKKVNATTEWQLNFSRKMGRPTFAQLTPYVNFADKNSLRRGNADIRPEFINLAEINFNKSAGKVNFLAALYFRQVQDPIAIYSFREPKNPSLLITSFINGKKNRAYGLDNTLKIPLSKTAEWTTNINVFNTYFSIKDYENEGWAWNAKSTLTLKVPKDLTMQLTGAYETPTLVPQGTRGGVYFLDFTVRKDLWNKTGVLSLIVNDIFDSKRMYLNYDTPSYLVDFMRRRDNRFVRLTLQKRFGKMDAASFKAKKAGNKSVREQSNMED
jgi:outer membrane receptor for ferrienterochelin and colicin